MMVFVQTGEIKRNLMAFQSCSFSYRHWPVRMNVLVLRRKMLIGLQKFNRLTNTKIANACCRRIERKDKANDDSVHAQ